MKNIYKIISGVALLAMAAACDLNKTPEFDDADYFAAFDTESVTVNEDAGTVSIPVYIASVDPKNTTVSYTVTDGSAVQGKNYELEDPSAVLVFDGQTRTQNIVIKITEVNDDNAASLGYESGYTGNLTFTVSLVSGGAVKIGAESTCTVTISDLDHPLASILGSYTVSGKENWDGDISWTATFVNDESDETVVWIQGLTALANSASTAVYGNVSEDLSTISIPVGQTFAYNSSYNAMLVGFSDGGYYYPEGTIVLTRTETGYVCSDPEIGYGYLAAAVSDGTISGWLTAYYPGISFTKN